MLPVGLFKRTFAGLGTICQPGCLAFLAAVDQSSKEGRGRPAPDFHGNGPERIPERSEIRMATSRETAKKKRSAAATNGDKPHVEQLSPEMLLEFYRKMVLVRYFEEACQTAFRQGKVGGYLHVYIGQEAVATGSAARLSRTTTRSSPPTATTPTPSCLGAIPRRSWPSSMARAPAWSRARAARCTCSMSQNGIWGGYGIVGGHIPLGVGMAYALRYQDNNGITQLYLGDGAIHNGAFHEAANLAGLWGQDGLNPCLFILENNQYGMGTSVERATAMTDLALEVRFLRQSSTKKVDGMDLVAVLEVPRAAHRAGARNRQALRARSHDLPPLPHGAADFLEKYRTKEEVREVAQARPASALAEQKLLESRHRDRRRDRRDPRRGQGKWSTMRSTSPKRARSHPSTSCTPTSTPTPSKRSACTLAMHQSTQRSDGACRS